MLGKLLCYEIRATGRFFLPCFAGVLGLSVLSRVFWGFQLHGANSRLLGILTTVFTLLLTLMAVASVIIATLGVIYRFYKNLLSNEGYLMHTLPVRPWEHVMAKLLSAMLWSILSIVVGVLCVLILGSLAQNFWEDLREFWAQLCYSLGVAYKAIGLHLPVLMVMLVLLFLLMGAANILLYYVAMSFGQRSDRHKVLVSIGVYFLILFCLQTLLALLSITSIPQLQLPVLDGVAATYLVLGSSLVLALALDAGLFALTTWNLRRHLNLQ
jgi:hypothetical protein